MPVCGQTGYVVVCGKDRERGADYFEYIVPAPNGQLVGGSPTVA